MKASQLEAVLRAAWIAAGTRSDQPETRDVAVSGLRSRLRDADPHGVYRADAPQAPSVDLEETQDIPLRECPVMPREPQNI